VTAPAPARPERGWKRWAVAAGLCLAGVVLSLTIGVGVNAWLGRTAGVIALRFVLYSTAVAAVLVAAGRPPRDSLLRGAALGASVALLRWLLDRVW
jgi:hypothetical protein